MWLSMVREFKKEDSQIFMGESEVMFAIKREKLDYFGAVIQHKLCFK